MKQGISPFVGRWLLASLLLVVVALPACKKKKTGDRSRPERRTSESSEKAPAVAENVVAAVGDLLVTRSEFEAELRRRKPSGSLNKVQKRNAERHALKSLIHRRLVELAAAAEGIEVTEEELEARWVAAVKRMGGDAPYQAFLTRNKYTEDGHREVLGNSLLRGRLRNSFFPEVVTEEQIEAYYEGYSENPGRGHKVRVSRILLKVDEAAHESRWKEAEARLQAIEEEIFAGLPFEKAVAEYSEGPYVGRDGDMGWATEKRRPVEVFGPALTMEVGEFKGPTRVKMGVQLLTVTATRNDAAGAFEAERENIRQILEEQRDQRNDRRLYEKLRARYRVEKFL